MELPCKKSDWVCQVRPLIKGIDAGDDEQIQQKSLLNEDTQEINTAGLNKLGQTAILQG